MPHRNMGGSTSSYLASVARPLATPGAIASSTVSHLASLQQRFGVLPSAYGCLPSLSWQRRLVGAREYAQAEAAALRDLCPSASHRHLGGGSSGGYYTHAPASSLTTKSSSSDGSSGATVVVVGWSEWSLARRTPERLRGALHAAQGEIQQQKRSEATEK